MCTIFLLSFHWKRVNVSIKPLAIIIELFYGSRLKKYDLLGPHMTKWAEESIILCYLFTFSYQVSLNYRWRLSASKFLQILIVFLMDTFEYSWNF